MNKEGGGGLLVNTPPSRLASRPPLLHRREKGRHNPAEDRTGDGELDQSETALLDVLHCLLLFLLSNWGVQLTHALSLF